MPALTALILACACLLSWEVRAELYRWTDANGQIHFSDKKPASEFNILDYKSQFGLPDLTLEAVTALPYRGEKSLRQVLVLPLNVAGMAAIKLRSNIGAFYFGPDCVSPTAMRWQQLKTDFPRAVPRDHALQDGVASTLRKQGYLVKRGHVRGGEPAYVQHDAYELYANLIDLELHTCAAAQTRKSRRRIMAPPQPLQSMYFNKSHCRVRIQWLLKERKSGKVAFTAISDGAAQPAANVDMNMHSAFLQAVKDAARRMTANDRLLEVLQQTSPPPAQAKKTVAAPPSHTAPQLQDRLSGIRAKFSGHYRTKARFAEVLAIFAGIKTYLMQHYMEHGKWPASFNELGVRVDDFTETGAIDQIKLGREGAVELDVSSSFGSGAFVLMTPRPNSVMIDWECRMSMADQVLRQIGTDYCQVY